MPYRLCGNARVDRYSRYCGKVLLSIAVVHGCEFVSNDRDLPCYCLVFEAEVQVYSYRAFSEKWSRSDGDTHKDTSAVSVMLLGKESIRASLTGLLRTPDLLPCGTEQSLTCGTPVFGTFHLGLQPSSVKTPKRSRRLICISTSTEYQ